MFARPVLPLILLTSSVVACAQNSDLSFRMQMDSRYSPHQADKIDRPPLKRAVGKDVGVTVYVAKRDAPGAFVVLVGSGWGGEARLVQRFLDAKISVAVVGGRYDVAVPRRDRVADRAKAIAYLYGNASLFKTDGNFVILADGYYAGIAAQLGTDFNFLTAAGVSTERLKGVVLDNACGLDGRTAVASNELGRKSRERDYGANSAAQFANTAIGTVATPNAPAWLLIEEETHSTKPVDGPPFVAALNEAGTAAELMQIPAQTGEVNAVTWGDRSNVASERLMAFVLRALAHQTSASG